MIPPIVRMYARRVFMPFVAVRAELAIAAAVLGGWGLVTLAIARLVRPDVVWPLSTGLLLLLLCGVQWFGNLFWKGLYVLTRKS